MKLTCDLCGGTLQMNAGAQDASCQVCGLCYPLNVLREKLRGNNAPVTPVTPVAPVVEPVIPPVAPQPVPQPAVTETPSAQQFVMPVERLFAACLSGTVQQGCIGVGETVYINGDYNTPYRLYHFDDSSITHAAAGQYARLYLVPHRKDALKQARIITGAPNPVANAYRFEGSVEAYFADLLQKNFGEYTLQQNMQWPGLDKPITFMLMKDLRPVMAVFVVGSDDSSGRYWAEKAAKYFAQAGIGCTHFYKDYRNDAPYVIKRIREAMG